MKIVFCWLLFVSILTAAIVSEVLADEVLLQLPGASTTDPETIDYAALPVLKGEHGIVSAFDETWQFQLHSYLVHHDGKFWCMWSQGPQLEDLPTQHVRFANSDNGINWDQPRLLTGLPEQGAAYVARDFWVRDGELLGLAASFQGRGVFGKDKNLKLQAFAWNSAQAGWTFRETLFDNTINNYAPQRLSDDNWMFLRRDAALNIYQLQGGTRSLSSWKSTLLLNRMEQIQNHGFSPSEPVWWEQPDRSLIVLFRNNARAKRIYRMMSQDHGATWSNPLKTNYPNVSSKICVFRTSQGHYVLVSNANPAAGRRELHLGLSLDGLTFTRLARLHTPSAPEATFQYPHVIEHDGSIFITYSNSKAFIEVLRVSLGQLNDLLALSQ